MVAMESIHTTFGRASVRLGWVFGRYLSEIWYVRSLRIRHSLWYPSLITLVRPVVVVRAYIIDFTDCGVHAGSAAPCSCGSM